MRFIAGLVGLPLVWGGFLGFIYGIFMLLAEGSSEAWIIIIVSFLAWAIAQPLGKYAKGD